MFERERQRLLEKMDDGPYKEKFEFREDLVADLSGKEGECRKPSWVDDFYGTCNTIHEIASTLDRATFIPTISSTSTSSTSSTTTTARSSSSRSSRRNAENTNDESTSTSMVPSSSSSVQQQQRLQLQDYDFKYLSAGGLRVAWRAYRSSPPPPSPRSSPPPPHSNNTDEGDDSVTTDNNNNNNNSWESDVVVKLYKLSDHSHYQSTLARVRYETLIMERVSSSPHILNVYGSCGTTMVVETMSQNVEDLAVPSEEGTMDQEELDELSTFWPHRQSQNNLTASEKLLLATSMARGLYDLHYYDGGQILHADVAIEQWLLSPAGQVKLNDFNYAEIMSWNVGAVEEEGDGGDGDGDGGYCPTEVRYSGYIRSPEELMGTPSDSSKDVFSFGHVIYQLLTGLSPFYDERFHGKDKYYLKPLIIKGVRPYVDKRYLDASSGVGYIEFHLAKIMMECWRHDPHRRPSIATILDFLQKTMIEAKKRGDLEPSGRIQDPPLVF
mmetsp:Transcript_26654/g.63551  ORF Transcript_26654/g.63551 Transcript_26654/m.63551 type:complete len:497 (-) Transcript_26654:340-1830(-)